MTTFAELKQAIIEDTHRPDLEPLVDRFVSECEGMIRRELTAHLLTAQLSDADRDPTEVQIYTLPPGVVILRTVAQHGVTAPEVIRTALGSLSKYPLSGPMRLYGEAGNGTIEFRGSPAEGTLIDITYYGMPEDLVNDDDTNTLLDSNETLYKSGAMFFLYQNTQDRELASDQLQVFNGVLTNLNEQIARKIGGAKITASYNFGAGSGY